MPPVAQVSSIPLSTLADFVLGHLSPEDSLDLLDRIENEPQASADLDFLIDLLKFAQHNPALKHSDGNTQ